MALPNAGLDTLAARAYELLDFVGHAVAEERLVQHVFGLTGLRRPEFWRGQLTRLLAAHDLFTQLPDGSWALAAWTSAADTLRSLRYVVVDVETTGLSPRTQTLIEIAALRCLGAQVLDTFTSLVDPGRPIPPFIRRFTGISEDMVAGAPGPGAAVEAFLRFAGADVLVGHNVRFDLNFLGAAAERHLGVAIANESLDTIALGTLLLPGLRRPSLDRLAAELSLSAPVRHRALAAATLTAAAFWQLAERDRKSTRLNSSHVSSSYAVFCLKKKNCGRRRARRFGYTSRPAKGDETSAMIWRGFTRCAANVAATMGIVCLRQGFTAASADIAP